MQVRLYNTLTNAEEAFEPLDPAGRRVTFYSCGPTVYDYAHIGNFRSFLNADLLRRTLELAGFEVQHVMNITDVGHMTEDDVADGSGEDKMAAAGRRLLEAKHAGTLPAGATLLDPNDPYAVADFYADAFLEDARTLGMRIAFEVEDHPELMPRPTRYVEPMIELVERLVERGHAYAGSDGVIYFDVQSFPAYGRLSGNTPDRIRSGKGGRVDTETQGLKRHPADFMLWKPDPTHLMRWPSPWGEGYPGWHLECSVMAQHLLGEQTGGVIDIHSGGEDNIFPHHECEIAQACGATGETSFARWWFHTRHLIVDGEKMSKSKGNFYTLRDLLAKGATPAAIRLELTKTHYRSNANFTLKGLEESGRRIARWEDLAGRLDRRSREAKRADDEGVAALLDEARSEFAGALADDLNVSGALGAVDRLAGRLDVDVASPSQAGAARGMLALFLDTLGLTRADLDRERLDDFAGDWLLPHTPFELGDEQRIEKLIAERESARETKDWATSDRIRDELLEMGVAVKDSAGGTTWERVVR